MLKIIMIHIKVSLKISLFDECSQLDISYSNTRFNDNFNTQPEEIKLVLLLVWIILVFLDMNNQLIYFLKNQEIKLWFINYFIFIFIFFIKIRILKYYL